MIIRRMRASFGKLHGELTLDEGMNLLCLPNEAGKSTWSAFLVAMLYGIDTSEQSNASNHGLPMKKRYKPWDGSAMEGAIELNWNGREITIERTSDRRAPMGVFRAYETASGVPVTELSGENCGRVLCGVERSVFERTAFIRQLGLTVTEDAALEKRLGALVTTGEDGAKSYSELEAELKKQRNRLIGSRTGRQSALTEQLSAVRKTLGGLYTLQDDALRITAEKAAAQEEVDRLEALEARYQRAQKAKKRAGLADLEQKTAAQEALCGDLAEQAERLPSEEALRALHRGVQTAEDALRTAKMEAALSPTEVRKPALPQAFEGMTGDEAKRKAADDCAEYERLRAVAPRKRWALYLCIACTLLGVGLCVAGILSDVTALLIAGLAVFAAALIGLATDLLLRGKRAAAVRARLHAADLIPLRYGLSDCKELPRLAEDYAAALAGYEEACAEAARKKQALEAAVTAAQSELDGLVKQCAAFAPDCLSPADLRDAIGKALHTRAQLATETRALETMRQQISSLRVILGDEELDADAEAMELDGAKLSYDLRQARQQLSDLTTRLAAKQGAIGATGSAVELEAEAELLTEQIADTQEKGEVVDLAMAALKRADETLRSRFSPQITADAGKLLAKLTDGKYPNVLLEPGMLLSVRSEDGTVMRPAAAMSCGTADQMYLALRLAMCARLLPEDAPLVLDDALVNFDDDRARAAIALLTDLAKNRQVILFTCRKFGD